MIESKEWYKYFNVKSDCNYAVQSPRSYMACEEKREKGSLTYKYGHYLCKQGIVLVWITSCQKKSADVSFVTVIDGRRYHRQFKLKKHTDRGVLIMAGKFIREITQ